VQRNEEHNLQKGKEMDTDELNVQDEVDVPAEPTDEVDTAEDTPTAKETKPSRPEVPTGYITPVAFAKLLTARLREQGKLDADGEVKPQVVYATLKNASKNHPFPKYDGINGRNNLIKLDENGEPAEAFEWWDAKDQRAAERKANAAAKATKKSAKAKAEPVQEAEQSDEDVVEAE
jgi:hypothetical protein